MISILRRLIKVLENGEPKELKRSRLFIAPVTPKGDDDKPPTITELERIKAYEPVVQRIADNKIELLPIPEVLHKIWIWVPCRVRGKVVKPISEDGVTKDFPVCKARVHICEVDKWLYILRRIPDEIIYRLRDDLLKPIEFDPGLLGSAPKFKVDPPKPYPKPDPIPGDPPQYLEKLLNVSDKRINPGSFSVNMPQKLRPLKVARTKTDLLKLKLPGTSKVEISKTNLMPQLDDKIRGGLMSPSAEIIRLTIVEYQYHIFPYLCFLPWIWPYFYHCHELAVLETDANGKFETTIWYQLLGDKPDLYFWVEYNIDGVWTQVYKPWLPCRTYWNYVCGTEVIIRLWHPKVRVCGELPSPLGTVVNIYRIGHHCYVSRISQDPTTVSTYNGSTQLNIGLTKYASGDGQYKRPFAKTLGFVVHFGTQLRSAGITHYKWFYRKVKDNDLNTVPDIVDSSPNPEKQWKVINTPVNIYYREEDRNFTPPHVSIKPYRLGPDSAFTEPIFKIPYRHPDLIPASELPVVPNVDRDWVSLNFFSAILDSRFGAESELTEEARALKTAQLAGLYEFKFELYEITGGVPTLVSLDKGSFQHPDPADISDFIPAPNVNLVPDPGDPLKAIGYTMLVRIDNNKSYAEIKEVEVAGVTADPVCGMLKYQNKTQDLKFNFIGSHPNDFANFRFRTVRGSGNVIPEATDTGHVVANSDNNDFALSSGEYTADVIISKLLPPECDDGAFAEHLYVNALATNGTSVELNDLDSWDLEGFALIQKKKTASTATSIVPGS